MAVPLFAFALRLTRDRTLAEDVVQEVLVRAWRRAEHLDPGSDALRGWLFAAAPPREVAHAPRITGIADATARDRSAATLTRDVESGRSGLMWAKPAHSGLAIPVC
ncbi:sigma factor [Pseudonocardia sp. CA-142604]|uniref:sigma factor n=1 Tax=Pseudonocardia sp. CA-142604 TaxID=3240024 RepID=UPI003D8BE0D9